MIPARRAAPRTVPLDPGRARPGARPRLRPMLLPWAGIAACVLGTAAPWPGPGTARAGTEEFSTFDVAAQEEDDESLLDHYMTRSPREWRTEWERAPQAIRTSQGCLTSGQWFIHTDLKLRSALGSRARFGLDLRQSESDAASYDYLDFSFKFPTRIGTPGVMFRPLYDKSRQDFAITWEAGTDTSALQFQVAFAFEDMFNNFWAFRQTQVGEKSEPYGRHPYEPGLRMVARHERWRAEVSGRYLTPSVKFDAPQGNPVAVASLWGTLADASFEMRALGLDWEARGSNQQALSTEHRVDHYAGVQRNFRRKWSAEVAVRRPIVPRLVAEAHWLYQERGAHQRHTTSPVITQGIDRLLVLETTYAIKRSLTARAGGMFDRITIVRSGNTPFSYGTRNESRAYLGLTARFGRVSVSGVESIELDPEPYDVWSVHDKGFLHLQATF